MGPLSEGSPQPSVMDCINNRLYLNREVAATNAIVLSTTNTAAMMSLPRVQATPKPTAASNESALNSSCLKSTSTALSSATAYCPHVHRVLMSDANTLHASDWEIPHCRAIRSY
jgi:hypothetical protein